MERMTVERARRPSAKPAILDHRMRRPCVRPKSNESSAKPFIFTIRWVPSKACPRQIAAQLHVGEFGDGGRCLECCASLVFQEYVFVGLRLDPQSRPHGHRGPKTL